MSMLFGTLFAVGIAACALCKDGDSQSDTKSEEKVKITINNVTKDDWKWMDGYDRRELLRGESDYDIEWMLNHNGYGIDPEEVEEYR